MNDSPGMKMSSGSVANAGSTVQTSDTSRNPSRVCSSRRSRRQPKNSSAPQPRVTTIDSSYALSAGSLPIQAKASGTSIASPNSISTPPSSAKIGK